MGLLISREIAGIVLVYCATQQTGYRILFSGFNAPSVVVLCSGSDIQVILGEKRPGDVQKNKLAGNPLRDNSAVIG